jgi:uncharacterized protein YjbI with pentapeptide repeats
MRTLTQQELNALLDDHALTWEPPGFPVDETFIPSGRRLQLDRYDLRGLDLSGRDLRSCRLVDCDLRNCNFSDSNISHSEFMRSDLRGANMSVTAEMGTDYTGCIR